jgi:hypothetical protein
MKTKMTSRKMTGKGRGASMKGKGMPKGNKSGGPAMPSKGGR